MKIFAPTKDPCRGELTPEYLFNRWANYLRQKNPNSHHEIQERRVRSLANEFDIKRVGWGELQPYYQRFHDFEEAGRTEFEIVFLGIGYANILRAGRIAEKYGEDTLNTEKLELFTDTYSDLTRKGFKPSRYALGFSSLVERGASIQDLKVCSRYAVDLARELIVIQRLCQLYDNICNEVTLPDEIARELNLEIEKTIRQEKEERGFTGDDIDGRIDLSSEVEKSTSPVTLSMVLDAALGIFKLMFR